MSKNVRHFIILFLLITGLPWYGAAQQAAPYRLTLRDAIEKGLQANLSVLVADTQVQEAEGTRTRRLSAALLPRVRAESYANVQNRNLRAFGISGSGFPAVVGPFSNYDFRVSADQNVFDLQTYRSYKPSQDALEASKLNYQDALNLITRPITALSLNPQSAPALTSPP